MIHLVSYEYNGAAIHFADDAYVNLTELCATCKKQPAQFLRLPSTRDFIAALAAETGLPATDDGSSNCAEITQLELGGGSSNCRDSRQLKPADQSLLVTARGRYGSGTWAHPNLALECARWLSPVLAVRCNRIILELLGGRSYSVASDKPSLLRIDAAIADTKKQLATKLARRWSALEVEGNVSIKVFLRAAGLKLPAVQCCQLGARLLYRSKQYGFAIGATRQRRGRYKDEPGYGRYGWHEVSTFPPGHIAAELRGLDHRFEDPTPEQLAVVEKELLPVGHPRNPLPAESQSLYVS